MVSKAMLVGSRLVTVVLFDPLVPLLAPVTIVVLLTLTPVDDVALIAACTLLLDGKKSCSDLLRLKHCILILLLARVMLVSCVTCGLL